MWSRYVDVVSDSNLVTLFIVGIKYFDSSVDMKLPTGKLELSNILIIKSPAKITKILFFSIGKVHMTSRSLVKSKIVPECGR